MRMMLISAVLGFASLAPAQETRTGYPTIYHTPLFKQSQQTCSPDEMRGVFDRNGVQLTATCPASYGICAFEGACILEQPDGSLFGVNFLKYDFNLERTIFFAIDANRCPYGYGQARDAAGRLIETCLDPYFTVSADSFERKAGDVLYVPKLVGLSLPTGEVHDGYVIVRDRARLMDNEAGRDRLVFFSGIQNDKDINNPFVRAMLDNIDYTFAYETVTEEKAREIRAKRNFPRLPKHIIAVGLK